MAKEKKGPGKPLKGKITDRIASGDIPDDAISTKRIQADDRPDPDMVAGGSGQSLGAARESTSKRSGKGAKAFDHDEDDA